jgi:WXG100 family type VII secretion target
MEGMLLVTPEELTNASSEFGAISTQITALHQDMLAKVRALNWEGEAASAYKAKFNALEASMNRINAMIQEHVRDLTDMAQQYTSAEKSAQAAAEGLPTSTLE